MASRSTYERRADNRLGVRRFREEQVGSPRLFAFPFAGGQSLSYRPLAEKLPATWGVFAIDPPGHGWVGGEPIRQIDAMADFYLEHVPRELLTGSVLFGHSLGGLVAWSLARRLEERNLPAPALILCGTRPPHRRDDYEPFSKLGDQRLLEVLIDMGGVPSEWAAEPELFDYFKGALRADFEAFETYSPPSERSMTPVLAMGSLGDNVCQAEHVKEWSRYCANLTVEIVTGGHLFVMSHPESVARRIVEFVDRPRRRAAAGEPIGCPGGEP